MKEQEEEEEEEEEVCSSLIKAMYMHLSISGLNVTHASPVLPPLFPLTVPTRFREADCGVWGKIYHRGLWHPLSPAFLGWQWPSDRRRRHAQCVQRSTHKTVLVEGDTHFAPLSRDRFVQRRRALPSA